LHRQEIDALNRGETPLYEPGLAALVASNLQAGRIAFFTRLPDVVRNADAAFIAVGTPARRGDGHADFSYVYAAAREIAAELSGFTGVVTKSTVPVGTGDEVERVRQRPWGTLATKRWPRGARPWLRVMLVLAQVSSMKTRRLGSSRP
jgi:UDPglucose 6-dehydrogenase